MILTVEGELIAQGIILAINETDIAGNHLLQLWFFSHDNGYGRSLTTIRCSLCSLRQQFGIDDFLDDSYWEEFFHMARLCGQSYGKIPCKAVE